MIPHYPGTQRELIARWNPQRIKEEQRRAELDYHTEQVRQATLRHPDPDSEESRRAAEQQRRARVARFDGARVAELLRVLTVIGGVLLVLAAIGLIIWAAIKQPA